MSDTITLEKARDIAYSWHSGQWSRLYSFASTGEITEGMLEEVDREMWAAKESSHYQAGDLTDLGLLREFLAKSLENENPLGFEPVNLDNAIDPKDLEELAKVLSESADYAANKAKAMKSRASGNIEKALGYEAFGECAYMRLPKWARW